MSGRDITIAPDWYQHSFDELYPIVYAHRTIEAAWVEAGFAIEQMNIASKDAVLDLCCGNGRHLAHLAEHTSTLVGLDYSRDLLRIAHEDLGPAARLVRADMQAIPFVEAFDVVTNFFTSFGYFQSAADNLKVVREVARSLKAGGRFFIDYIGREWAERTLQPESVREAIGYRIHEERWIDSELRRINKVTTISKDDHEVRSAGESVQLYTPEEFSELLLKGGLAVRALYGDYDGAPYESRHPRMIAVGEKL